MGDSSPSVQEWKNLYDAAIKFKEIECWNWMWDSDVFGVQNPANGEIGYCCVMGELGEHFALAVYLGTDGLEGYLKIQSGEILPGDVDVLHIQKCLMASFEDRKILRGPDLQLIKELGLKFRGRKSWPLFRSYRPGYLPWYLTGEEARYLALALQQAIVVALRFKEDEGMLAPPKENHYLVRGPEKEGEGLRWKEKWLEPSPLEGAEIVAEPVDEARLERIRETASRSRGIWEADFFYFPGGAEGGERPYFPLSFLLVDHRSGLILNAHLAGPPDYGSEFIEKFLSTIESTGRLPEEVLVKKGEVFKLLEPVTSRLEVKLGKVRRLISLEEARAGMFEFFHF